MSGGFKVLVMLVAAVGSAYAVDQPPSDITCRDRNGVRINTAECIAFLKNQQPLSDAECGASPQCMADVAARSEARRRYWQQRDIDERASIDRAQAAEDRRHQQTEAAVKIKCGADYKAPRVGMSIQRAKECVSSSLKVTAQLNRRDGVVTTYRSGSGAHFHVMDGVIVAWSR